MGNKKLSFLIIFIMINCYVSIDAQDLDLMMTPVSQDETTIDRTSNDNNIALLLKDAQKLNLSMEEIKDIYSFMNVKPTLQDLFDDTFPCLHGQCIKSSEAIAKDCMRDYKKYITAKYGIEVSLEEDLIKQTLNYEQYLKEREQCSNYQCIACLCVCCPCAFCVSCCND